MPSITCGGRYHSQGRCTDKGSTGAIGIPIKASSDAVAIRYADKMTLKLLPGWESGWVVIKKDGKVIESHTLARLP